MMEAENAVLHELELTRLAARIATRDLTAVEVLKAQLERIAALDDELHSYAVVTSDRAMAQAEAADAEIAQGRYRGALHGVPLAVKDVCFTENIPTAAGMAIHRNFRPGHDATVVQRLKAAGAVLLGKLQMTEGAYSDHHPSIAPPVNPWNADYWPGISSSGPGVALAAGLCYGAIASDTGGSIRWPSAANGVTGLKPTWSRVSRHGVFELAASLDHIGPMGRSAADVAAILAAIAGSDPRDPTTLTDPVPDYPAESGRGVRGLRVAVDTAWNTDGVDASVQSVMSTAIETFRTLGARIVEVRVPDVARAIDDWAPHCAVEAAIAHDASYPSRKADYGPVLASVLDAGHALSGPDFQRIRLRRMDLCGRFVALFRTIDLLVTPVQPFAPLSLSAIRTLGEQPDLIAALQRYTCPFNMTGNPTITLPGGFSQAGLPIGFQLVAGHLAESALLRAGTAFQGITSWHRRHPPARPPFGSNDKGSSRPD